MPLNAATGKLVKAIVHDNHFYRIPGCFRIGETMTVTNLMFEPILSALTNSMLYPKLPSQLWICQDGFDNTTTDCQGFV